MKNKKIKIKWLIQPAHGDSMTYLNDGKMYLKVGPADCNVEIRFVAHGIGSVSDKLTFDTVQDAYSYYNQQYVDQEKGK